MSSKHPWRLAEISLKDVRSTLPQVAVMTFGATEPHNLHLPYGTDNFEVEAIADGACAKAWSKGARIALLPHIPFGNEQNLFQFPLAIHVEQEVLNKIVESAAQSLERHGILKLVLLNGHGGNEFKACLRTLLPKTKVFCCLVNFYQMMADVSKSLFENPGDHADEMETSLMQALRPDLVDLSAADSGIPKKSRFDAARNGWAWYPRPFDKLTTNSGCGDPRKATPAKGEQYLETACERLAQFLVELHDSKIDASFPFE